MPRTYFLAFNGVTISAAQDLFEVSPASNKPVKLISAVVTVDSDETNQQLKCTVQRRTGSPTSGSGGSTPTAYKVASADASAGFSVEANNTTRASGGTQEVLHAEGWPSQGGWAYKPIPEEQPVFIDTELLIIGFEVAPTAGIAMSGSLVVQELA